MLSMPGLLPRNLLDKDCLVQYFVSSLIECLLSQVERMEHGEFDGVRVVSKRLSELGRDVPGSIVQEACNLTKKASVRCVF